MEDCFFPIYLEILSVQLQFTAPYIITAFYFTLVRYGDCHISVCFLEHTFCSPPPQRGFQVLPVKKHSAATPSFLMEKLKQREAKAIGKSGKVIKLSLIHI